VREQNEDAIAYNKKLLKSLEDEEITPREALQQKRELLAEVDLNITRQWVCKYPCPKKQRMRVYIHHHSADSVWSQMLSVNHPSLHVVLCQ
jgi:hypothetical protein